MNPDQHSSNFVDTPKCLIKLHKHSLIKGLIFPLVKELAINEKVIKRNRAYSYDVVIAPGDLLTPGEEIRDGAEELPDLRFHIVFGHCYCSICSALQDKKCNTEEGG